MSSFPFFPFPQAVLPQAVYLRLFYLNNNHVFLISQIIMTNTKPQVRQLAIENKFKSVKTRFRAALKKYGNKKISVMSSAYSMSIIKSYGDLFYTP